MGRVLFLSLGILALVATTSANAADDEAVQPARLELGATLGTPALANVIIGYWGRGNLPFVFQVAGGYFGSRAFRGCNVDLGLAVDNYGALKQVISLSAGTYRYEDNLKVKGADYFGPSYQFNMNGFRVQAGLSYASQPSGDHIILGQANIGYSFLFDL